MPPKGPPVLHDPWSTASAVCLRPQPVRSPEPVTRAHELNLADIELWKQVLPCCGQHRRRCGTTTMAQAETDQLSISLLTREYPPSIYGGTGVHASWCRNCASSSTSTFSAWASRARRYRARREPIPKEPTRPSACSARTSPWWQPFRRWTWSTRTPGANLAGHLAGLLRDIPHVVTAHSLEPHRPWKAEQLGAATGSRHGLSRLPSKPQMR